MWSTSLVASDTSVSSTTAMYASEACRYRGYKALAAALDYAGDAVTELRPHAIQWHAPSEPPSTASWRSAVIVASLPASCSSASVTTQGDGRPADDVALPVVDGARML